jgi:hypothetical protein
MQEIWMPIYKKPEEKAGETVTVRLTLDERRMLDHLSALDQMTLTDFIRNLIAKRATELNVTEVPPPKPRRRPGRPKSRRTDVIVDSVEQPINSNALALKGISSQEDHGTIESHNLAPEPTLMIDDGPLTDEMPLTDTTDLIPTVPIKLSYTAPLFSNEQAGPPTFNELIARFRNSFMHRAEGTKRELEDTIRFLCLDGREGNPIIQPDTLVSHLTVERLAEIRKCILEADIRLAKKNLHLTYLRMMIHFGTKEPDFDLRINPSRELPPFSIIEADERRRFFTGLTE